MLKNVKATSQKKSLLTKMLLFIGVPAAIIFCITALIVLSNVKQSVTQLTTSELTAESQSASYQISNYFSNYMDIAEQLKLNPTLQNYLQSTGSNSKIQEVSGFKDIDQLLRNITSSDPDNIIDTWVADTATNTCVDPADGISNLEILSRPWYKQLEESKQTIITAPYEDNSTKALTVSMITPIYKDGDTLIGVAGVDITLDRLYNTVKDYKLGNSGFYILVSSDGTLVYYPDDSLKNKSVTESKMSENIIKAIQNKTAGTITYTAMD